MGNQPSSSTYQDAPHRNGNSNSDVHGIYPVKNIYHHHHHHQQQHHHDNMAMPALTDTSRSSSVAPDSPTASSPKQEHVVVKVLTTATTNTATNNDVMMTPNNNNNNNIPTSWRSEGGTNASSSWRSGTTSSLASIRANQLHHNMVRVQHRDPMSIFELVNIMGEGSMGSVCKVKKQSKVLGGSARPGFVKEFSQRRKSWTQGGDCCFQIPLLSDSIRKALESTRRPSLLTSSSSNNRRALLLKRSSQSTIGDSRHPSKQPYYALKSLLLDKCGSPQLQQELLNEVAILKELDQPHICKAYETYEHDHRIYLCLELCSGGDLYARDPYTEHDAADILSQILSAVAYLHSKGIIHRDLKFENIMFVDKRPDAEVKLIDFGLSQKFAENQGLSDAVGTVYTMAPELLAGHYNSKADVWSIGVIAFMLLSSSMPFYGPTRYMVMKRILKGHVKFSSKRWKKISNFGKGFVRHLLEHDPSVRPSADRALTYTKKWLARLQGSDATTTAATAAERRQRWARGHSRCEASFSAEENLEMMDRIQASMRAFSEYSTLKKLALMVIAYKSTASEIGWLRTTFNRFDLHQNGEISFEEFSQAMSEVYDYSEEELEVLFSGMDVDGTESVHYSEFLAATLEAHGTVEEDRIADAFDRIDADDSGYITIQNLRDFLGDDVPNEYLEQIIDDADILQDHRVSYEEFLALWHNPEKLTKAKQEVAQRRFSHQDSIRTYNSYDGETEETTSVDESDDEEEMNAQALEPKFTMLKDIGRGQSFHAAFAQPVIPQVEQQESHPMSSAGSFLTPVMNNKIRRGERDGAYNDVNQEECFNRQKVISLRVGDW